jgi:hypothetical protein
MRTLWFGAHAPAFTADFTRRPALWFGLHAPAFTADFTRRPALWFGLHAPAFTADFTRRPAVVVVEFFNLFFLCPLNLSPSGTEEVDRTYCSAGAAKKLSDIRPLGDSGGSPSGES